MNISLLCSFDNLVHGDVAHVVAVLDVVRQGAVEKDRLLGDDTQLTSYPGHVQALNIMIVNRLKIILFVKLKKLVKSDHTSSPCLRS